MWIHLLRGARIDEKRFDESNCEKGRCGIQRMFAGMIPYKARESRHQKDKELEAKSNLPKAAAV